MGERNNNKTDNNKQIDHLYKWLVLERRERATCFIYTVEK